MKALQVDRSLPRFAVARLASEWRAGAGGRFGPLRLVDVEPPPLPGPGWQRLLPRLTGICGSDLATVDGRSSRWFEPIVSFPFVPGHEVVADTEDGRRAVIEPVLGCQARGISPMCPACRDGRRRHCVNLTGGHLRPGLQTGYCNDTGGGWSLAFAAHQSQLHYVPDPPVDEAAVLAVDDPVTGDAVGAVVIVSGKVHLVGAWQALGGPAGTSARYSAAGRHAALGNAAGGKP